MAGIIRWGQVLFNEIAPAVWVFGGCGSKERMKYMLFCSEDLFSLLFLFLFSMEQRVKRSLAKNLVQRPITSRRTFCDLIPPLGGTASIQ